MFPRLFPNERGVGVKVDCAVRGGEAMTLWLN